MRKEVWFGLSIMAAVVIIVFWFLPPASQITNGHLGLLMLALIVIAIMLGFPTAFTLMGMGVIFAWLAYRSASHETAMQQTLDLMVQRAYSVMSNDVLISIPLFVFMGYLVERSNLIEKLFRSLHLALARIPGSLAVATLVTCAVFATATGIVGAVVTLMGLLALPAMLRAGYNIKVSAGVITAGGCLGILIPPSVMLIVYGATAGVSVVKLYAGAFFPGIMLAGLYIVYVVILAKIKPSLMPPLPESERRVTLPEFVAQIKAAATTKVLPALVAALKGRRNARLPDEADRARAAGDAAARHRLRGAHGADLARAHQARRRDRHLGLAVLRRERPSAGEGPRAFRSRPADRRAAGAADGDALKPQPPAPAAPRSEGAGRDARTSAGAQRSRCEWKRVPAPDRLLDRIGCRHARADRLLHVVHIHAARSFQDAARIVLPARGADPRGARHDRVRTRDADRGGRGRIAGRLRPGRDLYALRAAHGAPRRSSCGSGFRCGC